MLKYLEGKRSYLIALGIGLLAAAHSLGFVNDQMYQSGLAILAGGGLATLRAAVTNLGNTTQPK